MKNTVIVSVYASHNASVSLYYNGEYHVVEVERWLNLKNAGLTLYYPCKQPQIVFDEIIDYLLKKVGKTHIDVYLTNYVDKIEPKYLCGKKIGFDHHTAHAATAFYQSPHDEMLVFTFDGGGDGGYFNVYKANRETGIQLIEKFNHDLGYPYMLLADHLNDIKKEPLNIGNLVYAGKLMGLCSYGKVREDWLPHFEEYYSKFKYTGDAFFGGTEVRPEALTTLFKNINVEFDLSKRFEGQLAWDIAATTQRAFENTFFKYAKKFLDENPDMPVGLAGGCALNVLLNSKILDYRDNKKVFVPPNVNDCGISVGGILWYLNPKEQVDLTYSGLPILDHDSLGYLINENYLDVVKNVTLEELAIYLNDGHIVGIIQGRSEHGSRALGNRSIICDPREGMKDKLNHKVKKREWYRPFAPMVRLEDAPKYFHFPTGVESRHMVFVATVKDEWSKSLASIRHEDGTGRLQTVTEKQNKFIYDLLSVFGEKSGHSVLLNTSFNVNGRPILTRLQDAFKLLIQSELDAVLYEGNIYFKSGGSKSFDIIRKNKTSSLVKDNTTVVLHFFTQDKNELEKYKTIAKNIIDGLILDVCIMTNADNVQYFSDLVNERVFIHSVADGRKYFVNRLYKKDVSIIKSSEIIKCLWFKELVRENHFNNNKHAFFDISYKSFTHEEINDYLSNNVNENYLISGESRVRKNSIFGDEYFERRYPDKSLGHTLNLKLLYAKNEDIEQISNMYEAYLLEALNEDKVGIESDYLDFPYLQIDKKKVIRV